MKIKVNAFGDSYSVMPGVSIDASGIHDGAFHFAWGNVRACSIAVGGNVETIFGDDDSADKPYVLSLTHHDGSTHDIALEGLSEESAAHTGWAINHFSGRRLVESGLAGMNGSTLLWVVVITAGIVAIAALYIIILVR